MSATIGLVPVLRGLFYQPFPRSPLHLRPPLRFITTAHENAVDDDGDAGKLLSSISHTDGRRRFDPVAACGCFVVHRTGDSTG
uniref:Uncharacterized protein n=1 Tax=Leersia perrieri TaxID=77586 RepID=A0A0D9XZ53_9ORYZ